MDPLGLSFMPGENGSADPNGQKPSPIQQAIQTLSLRIPRTVGAASGAPQELLMGAGGAGLGGGNPNAQSILEQIRRMLFGGGANFGGQHGMPGAGLPPMTSPGAPIGGPPSGRVPNPSVGFDPNHPNGAPVEREPGGGGLEKPGLPTPPPAAPVGGLNAGFFERGQRNKSL